MKTRQSLDSFDILPAEMRAYLRHNGWHFNKKMFEFACKHMRKSGKPIDCVKRDAIDELLKKYGISISDTDSYDYVYVANMCKADFLGTAIEDEKHMVQFVKDYIEDEDQADGFVFHRFYADCCLNGIRVPWEDCV